MGELRELLLRDYEINGRRSLARARAACRHLELHLDLLPAPHVHDLASRYVQMRTREKAKPATVRYELAILRRALNLAFRSGRLDRRPYVPAIQIQNARAGFFEADQVEALIARLPDPIDDMARFGWITGWRVSEIRTLEWTQVDRASQTVRLDPGTTKNGDGRSFPYGEHPELVAMLDWRYRHRRGGQVFHRDGRPVLHFRRSWITACERAQVGRRLFHDLRRSAVRNMERAGVPRSVQMKLVGLKTESIHRRYAITNEEDLARAVQLLARQESRSAGPHSSPK